MALDFGLIYEVVARPQHDKSAAQEVFRDLVNQVSIADQVGFHTVWNVEHHFLPDLSQASNNDVLLGAYAAATSNIRIGYGVKLLPFNYNHPVKAAEAGAVLDQISGGRAEFGTGRSVSREELEGFGIEPDQTRPQWQESLQMIVKAWEDEEFTWDSESFKIPPRHVLPKPVQDPHPPLWVAGSGPDSHSLAGELGIGMLTFSVLVPLDEISRRIGLYKEGIKRCTKPAGKYINDKVAPFAVIYCGETDEEARETAAAAAVEYSVVAAEIFGRFSTWAEKKESYAYVEDFEVPEVTFDHLNDESMCIVGSPDTCIEKVRKYEKMGADMMIGNFQPPGLPVDKVKASIERFGKNVIPAFQ